jgi:polyhydroxyalkanoate synthesis regulator phasin
MQDAWRAYLELALGLTETSRKRAQAAVRKLASSGGATAGQLQGMAEELMSTGLANREALTKLVRFEVDRALGVVGLATTEEVAELTGRVRQLERELREARETLPAPAAEPPIPGASAGKLAKKAVAKKAVAKKAVAKRTGTAAPAPAPANEALAKKAPVKRAAVAKAAGVAPVAKRVAPKKLPPGGGTTAAKQLPPATKNAAELPSSDPGAGAA